MDVRSRSTQSTESGGYWFRTSEPPGTQHPRSSVNAYSKSILDYTNKTVRKEPDLLAGFLPPSDLELREDWLISPRMSRSGSGLNLIYAATDYQGDLNVRTTLYKPRGSLARQQENALYSIQTLARSNPFRTDYSIPVAIAELLDVSSMFRFVGKSLLAFAGGSYLNIRFGWEQFLRDLEDIQKSVNIISSRVKEFESLNKHGGLRRKVWLDTLSVEESNPSKTIQSSLLGRAAKASIKFNATMKVYGAVRWVPKQSFRDVLNDLDKTNLSIQTIFGLGEIDASQIWNMIPLTWVIDYFFAVSEFLQALSGQDYIEPRDLCIMREYRHTEKISPTTNWLSVSCSKGKAITHIKARDIWVPVDIPPFQVRLLSGTQLTTLGALIATLLARIK